MIKFIAAIALTGLIGGCATSHASPTTLPPEDLELATMRDGGDADLNGDGIVDLRVRKERARTMVERLERGIVWHSEVYFGSASLGVNVDGNRDGKWDVIRRTSIDSDGSTEEVQRDEDFDGTFERFESTRIDFVKKTRRVVLKRVNGDGVVQQISDVSETLDD